METTLRKRTQYKVCRHRRENVQRLALNLCYKARVGDLIGQLYSSILLSANESICYESCLTPCKSNSLPVTGAFPQAQHQRVYTSKPFPFELRSKLNKSSPLLSLSLSSSFCHGCGICLRETFILALFPILHRTSLAVFRPNFLSHTNRPTSHFANLSSISPRLSAFSRSPSLSERRTTRAATARYRL